jgi:competence protein ComEA
MIRKRKKYKGVNGFVVLLLIMLLLYSIRFIQPDHEQKENESAEDLFIQIEGDVKNPGVYSFGREPKLKELICRAGGAVRRKGSLDGLINRSFQSGSKVNVYWDGKEWNVIVKHISSFYKLTLGLPVSLNSETEIGFTAIPGIGPKLARSIIQERNRRGGFKKLNELLAIPGISEKKYDKIVTWITL